MKYGDEKGSVLVITVIIMSILSLVAIYGLKDYHSYVISYRAINQNYEVKTMENIVMNYIDQNEVTDDTGEFNFNTGHVQFEIDDNLIRMVTILNNGSRYSHSYIIQHYKVNESSGEE